MHDDVSVLLSREGLSHVSSSLCDDSLDHWLKLHAEGRPGLLQALKVKGVAKLSDRQAIANVLGRHLRRTKAMAQDQSPRGAADEGSTSALSAVALDTMSQGQRQMNEIRPKLWLGTLQAASDLHGLHQLGVSRVLSIGEDPCYPAGAMEHHLLLHAEDRPDEDIARHFEPASAFLADALAAGEGVLVHCMAGQSRSATIVAAHLIRSEGLNAPQALAEVTARRLSVQPNDGFVSSLFGLAYELGNATDAFPPNCEAWAPMKAVRG